MDERTKYTVGWLGFFTAFMGLDALAVKYNKPTFSRAITGTLPWWVVVPAAGFLAWHMHDMYRKPKNGK